MFYLAQHNDLYKLTRPTDMHKTYIYLFPVFGYFLSVALGIRGKARISNTLEQTGVTLKDHLYSATS